MRYTKTALLTFGAGCALGLLVDVFETGRFARVASGLMALGLLAIPVGIAVDGWLAVGTLSRAAKKPAKRPTRRKGTASSRRPTGSRKPAATKR